MNYHAETSPRRGTVGTKSREGAHHMIERHRTRHGGTLQVGPAFGIGYVYGPQPQTRVSRWLQLGPLTIDQHGFGCYVELAATRVCVVTAAVRWRGIELPTRTIRPHVELSVFRGRRRRVWRWPDDRPAPWLPPAVQAAVHDLLHGVELDPSQVTGNAFKYGTDAQLPGVEFRSREVDIGYWPTSAEPDAGDLPGCIWPVDDA